MAVDGKITGRVEVLPKIIYPQICRAPTENDSIYLNLAILYPEENY